LTIRARYILTIWISAALLAGGAAGTVAGIRQVSGIVQETLLFGSLVEDLYILRGLTYEYELHPSPRLEEQWHAKYEQIGGALAGAPGIPEEISEAFANLRSLFLRISQSSPGGYREDRRLGDRLTSQIVSSLNTEAGRISDWLRDFSDDARRHLLLTVEEYSIGAVALLALLAGLTGWMLLSTQRRIVHAASVLREGAEAVARGDLDRRTELPGADEFSALASAFNSMTMGLARQATLEARLAQAQKLEAMGTLAGGIAHDFNNLLSGIMGFTEMSLLRLPPDSPVRQDLQEVMRASERAADLIRQILAFSRMGDQEARPVRVRSIIAEALKLLRASIPSTVEFRTDLASDAMVLADPGEIHRILVNLCTNSYLAMRERGGLLGISLREVELDGGFCAGHPGMRPGRFLRLTVSDTGQGMTPEVKARIFDPYFTTRAGEGGTGMGLSVVHGIVSRRGGAITVESEPGQGATFEIHLPLASEESGAEKGAPEAPLRGSGRILVVDDDLLAAELLEKQLTILGYQVHAFTGSPAALAAFEKEPHAFDLVITDMTMPGMTGDLLMFRLRAIRPDIPVVLCTAYSEWMPPDKARALGVSEYVTKPFSLADLSRVIRRLLDKG
jgi:signal transduction histidine kinase/CheY-like chemotaxis protein